MSGIQIPVTDAFDDDKDLQSVTVDLGAKQVEWLETRARELDLSLDEVLQAVVDAQIRLAAERRRQGDGSSRKGSVVDSLRSANQRLQEMMDQTRSRNEETSNTLSRLRARLGDGSPESTGDAPPSVQPSASASESASDDAPDESSAPPSSTDSPSSNDSPSMFDMMNE